MLKSPAQLEAEVSLLSQEAAKIFKENDKRALELQKKETMIRVEKSKNDSAIMVQKLREFTKKNLLKSTFK